MIENKKIIISVIICITAAAVLSAFICADTSKKVSSFYDDYICGTILGANSGYDPTINNSISIPRIIAIDEKNYETAKKINNAIWSATLANIPANIAYSGSACTFTLQSDDYLSCVSNYHTVGGSIHSADEICVTIDLAAGEAVYLDDLININDELIKKIKTPGFVKTNVDSDMQGSVDHVFSQKQLDAQDSEEILAALDMCAQPYTKENYICKPHFYLEKNRLYFVNLFYQNPYENYSEFYVDVEDLTEFLKVEPW